MVPAARLVTLLLTVLLCLSTPAYAQSQAQEQSKEEQQRIRQQLQQIAAEHARNQGARQHEEKQLQELLSRQSNAQRTQRALQQQVAASEAALRAVETEVSENEQRSQTVLNKLRELAGLHLRIQSAPPQQGDGDANLAQARYRAWSQHIGRQRAALLTELDAQNRKHHRLLNEKQSVRDAIQAQLDAQAAQLRKLDRIADEHRKTVKALQAKERRDTDREQQLQKRLSALDGYLTSLSRRKITPQSGLKALKGRLTWPVKGKVLQRFGSNQGVARSSRGTLIALKPGTEVPAIHDGVVAWVGWMPKLGLALVMDHGKDYFSLYAHAETVFYGVGDKVAAGTPLLLSGQTGSPPQPALYLELREGRKSLNPKRWFRNPP